MKVEAKVSGECFVYVQGMSMNCPLCGVVVRSGEQHACKTLKAKTKPRKKRAALPPQE